MTGLFKNSCNMTSALVLFSFKLCLSWRILPVFSHAVWYIANDATSQKTLSYSSVWPLWGFPLHISHPSANIYTHRATFVTKLVMWFIYSQNFLLFINSSAIKPGLNLWPQSSFVLTVGQNLISWHLRCNLWPCPWIYIHMFYRCNLSSPAALQG